MRVELSASKCFFQIKSTSLCVWPEVSSVFLTLSSHGLLCGILENRSRKNLLIHKSVQVNNVSNTRWQVFCKRLSHRIKNLRNREILGDIGRKNATFAPSREILGLHRETGDLSAHQRRYIERVEMYAFMLLSLIPYRTKLCRT